MRLLIPTAALGYALARARSQREDLLSLIVLFAWSFAAATILPISSEVPLALVVRTSGSWLVPMVVAGAGN